MSDYAFGIDLSKYQCSDGNDRVMVDFDAIARHSEKVAFIFARAAISWGYTDPRYSYYRREAARIGVPFGSYHYCYPSQPVAKQMDHFLRVVEPSAHDRLVLDMETAQGLYKGQITNFLLAALEYLKVRTGRYPIVYSRAQWVNDNLLASELPEGLDWWLADYAPIPPGAAYAPEKAPPPRLPAGVTNWLIHQTGGYTPPLFNVASRTLDYDRWNGDEAAVRAYFGFTEGEPPEEPEPPVEEKPLYKAVVVTTPPNRLRVRFSPAGDFKRWLQSGEEVDVYQELGDWRRIEPNGWSAAEWLQRVDETPAEEVPLYKAVVVTTPPNRLRVRFSPAGNFKRWLQSGEEVDVYQELGDWRRIEADGWSAAEWLQRVDETPPGEGENIFYSQRDPRWGEDYMGASIIKMKNEGCLVTATAALLTRLGFPETPGTYNDKASRQGGYQYPNLMYWGFPHILYPQIVKSEDKSFSYGTGFESYLNNILNDGRDALGMVDFIPGGTFNQHWVRIYKREGGLYYLHDPWYGNSQALHARYQKLFRIVGYRRTA